MKRFLCALLAALLALPCAALAYEDQPFTEEQTLGQYSFKVPAGWKVYLDDDGARLDCYERSDGTGTGAAIVVLLMDLATPAYTDQKGADAFLSLLMESTEVSNYSIVTVDECPASRYTRRQKLAGEESVVSTATILNRNSALTVVFSTRDDSAPEQQEKQFDAFLSTFVAKQDPVKYPEGIYKVGSDLDPGEYIIFADGSFPAYFSISRDSNGDKIIANDNFDYNSIITVKKGEYLKVSRGSFYPMDEYAATRTMDTTKSGSMFKVGVTLEPGEYKIKADSSGKGYYCIYKSSRQDKIVANDNFSGQAYVTVKKGQYLVLNRCTIVSKE